MSYPKHEDDRGIFQELARLEDIGHPIHQVSFFTINSGKSRGKHYHKLLMETFVILEGSCNVSVCNTQDDSRYSLPLVEGDCYSCFPGEQHEFYSEKGCKILVLASNEFSKENPDVYSV